MSATSEDTEETLTRFNLDGVREHVKRIWAAMHGESDRGPVDYPPWDDERRILINIIRRQADRGGGNYNESGSPLLKWILGILSALAVAVIVGGVTVYGRFTSLETRFAEWQTSAQRQLDVAYQRIDRLENRRP